MKVSEHVTDEQRLIEAAQRDPRRFALLYEANFDRVYAFVARRVPTRDEAEDITAEVFHQALAGLANYQWQGRPFVAWLLGIASHLIARRWQQAANVKEIEVDDLDFAMTADHAERQALFSQLLERLPEDQRHVIQRRFLQQRSIREIAREMDRSEGAVKQLQFRALETLRSQVRNRHE